MFSPMDCCCLKSELLPLENWMIAPDPPPRKMHLSMKCHCRFQGFEKSPWFHPGLVSNASILRTGEVAAFQGDIWRYPQSRCQMIKDKVFGRKRGQWATETVSYIIVTRQILAKVKYWLAVIWSNESGHSLETTHKILDFTIYTSNQYWSQTYHETCTVLWAGDRARSCSVPGLLVWAQKINE